MPLNTLTLGVTSGVIGRPFRARVNGVTAGSSVVIANGSALGFGYSNGFVTHPSLPQDLQVVRLTERKSGDEVVTSEIAITAVSEFASRAAASLAGGTSYRAYAALDANGNAIWSSAYQAPGGALVAAPFDGVSTPTPTPTPTPVPTLTATPAIATITTLTAPGTLLSTIGNLPDGASLSVSPNDGRLAVTGNQVVVGLSASSVGTVAYTISAPGSLSVVLTVTVEAVTDTITTFRGANTLAGHGSVNLGALLPEPMVATSSTYTPVSGTSAHWTLPTNGGHPVPSAAGVAAVLNGGPYVWDYTISDGTRTVTDRLTTNAVSSWTPDAEVTGDPRVAPRLVDEPLMSGTTRFYTCVSSTELDAIRTAATANGAVIFIPRGLTTRPNLLLNNWATATGKWAIVTDEDRNRRSRLSRLWAQNGTMDRFAVFGTHVDRSVDKDGGTFSTGAYQFSGIPRVILADLYYDSGSSSAPNTCDAVRILNNSGWTYVSGDLRRFASIEHYGGDLIIGDLYSTGCFNNTIITGSTGAQTATNNILVKKIVAAGSDMLGSSFNGWHQDVIQIRDNSTTIQLFKVEEMIAVTSPRFSMQGMFGGFNVVQRIEVENFLYQGRAMHAFRPFRTPATGYVRRCTIVAEPDSITRDLSDYPGSVPSIDFGTANGSTCAIEDCFVIGTTTLQAGQTTARNTVLGANRNTDVSTYFADPIDETNEPAELSAKQLEPIFRAAYAPTTALRNGDNTYQGAFMPDGSRNVGLAA